MNAQASSAKNQTIPRLTDSQLREMMRLIQGAHSVELKLTVPASHHRATIQGLPMDPVEAQPRQIYFFDTPDLQLYKAGVVVRARRIAGGRGDTVVKLRPVDPSDIPDDLKNDPAFNIEVDALPGGFVCSASFKGRSTGKDIRSAVSGKKRLSKIFSKAQRSFYRLHAPAGIDLDSLVPLGPTFILKGKFPTPMGIDGKTVRSMVAEVWLYPDGSRIMELSTKCEPGDALIVASEARAYLVDHHVPTNAAQETKTRTALEFYSKALMEEIAEETAAAVRAKPTSDASKPVTAKAHAVKAPRAKASATKAKTSAKGTAPAKAASTDSVAVKSTPAKPAAAKAAAKSTASRPAATTSRSRSTRAAGTSRTTTRRTGSTTRRTSPPGNRS